MPLRQGYAFDFFPIPAKHAAAAWQTGQLRCRTGVQEEQQADAHASGSSTGRTDKLQAALLMKTYQP